MAEPFNYYQKWLGIPLHQQPPHHYRLLGLELFESDPDVIAHAADRQMAHVRTLSTGEHVALAQQLLNEISAARVQLLNPQKKVSYDAALNADLAGQQSSTAPTAQPQPTAHSATTTAGLEPEEEETPVWKHPAVLTTAAVCFILVIGICTTLYVRSKSNAGADAPSAPTWTEDELASLRGSNAEEELSPGKMAEVPVDPNESKTEPPENQANAADNTKPDPAGSTTEPEDASSEKAPTTEPTSTNQPPATQTASKQEPPTGQEETSTPPSDPVPRTTDVSTSTGTEPHTEPLDASLTADDPGPPEPDENATPIVKMREILPIPDAEAIAKTLAEVKEIFAAEYAAAKSFEQRRALAQFLWRQAQEVQEDPVSHYVLMTESRAQAEAGGDFEFTMRMADIMKRYFLVNGLEMKIESLGVFSRSAKNNAGRHIVATAAVDLADEASREHEFDTAEKLATQAQSLAQRVGDNNLRQKARQLGNEIRQRRIAWATIQAAIDKLETSPNDAEAHFIYGKYLCLTEEDWELGLPHLAQCNNVELSKLAQQDLADPQQTAEQIALADAWFDFAQSDPEWERFRLREHHWYLTALPEATGLMRTKLEKRLRENPLVRFKVSWLSLPSREEAENQRSPFE